MTKTIMLTDESEYEQMQNEADRKNSNIVLDSNSGVLRGFKNKKGDTVLLVLERYKQIMTNTHQIKMTAYYRKVRRTDILEPPEYDLATAFNVGIEDAYCNPLSEPIERKLRLDGILPYKITAKYGNKTKTFLLNEKGYYDLKK